ncbi:hypothetical protein SEA_BOOHOO_92 [Gordonia Phage Boohoo]|nr:hypothetical protein SEA_BOOHOO_92 [Gordonia Phage Boohoo]UVD39839.1 hypothetical protein SEA_ANAYSIA_93 [Gordonia phage Anaysia]
MFKATLVHVVAGIEVNSIEVDGESVESLLVQMRTSATARGIEITEHKNVRTPSGDIVRNGEIAGYWKIDEVPVVEGVLVA